MNLKGTVVIMTYSRRGKDEEKVPRHREINEKLAKAILKKMGIIGGDK